jgi:GDPmannose 4,6-dehydratase
MSDKKSALITGVTGQDGQHMAEILTAKGYDIYGVIRGQNNDKRVRFEQEFPGVTLLEADLTDPSALIRAVEASAPD